MHFLLAPGDLFPVPAAATTSFALNEAACVAALGMAESSADSAGTRLQTAFKVLRVTVRTAGDAMTLTTVSIVL